MATKELLDHTPPFSLLTEAGKALLNKEVQYSICPQGAAVLFKGQRASGAYFVVEGRLRVYSLAPDGTEATLYFIDPGETCVFALNSLFNDLRYPAWVQAEAETKVAVISGAVFRKLFQSEPVMQDITVRALSTLVFRLMEELEEIHAYKLEHRLANLLLTHASEDGEVRMTQQQIANHLGTTREVIARLMREFVAAGYVVTKRGLSIVSNPQALSHLIASV